MSTSAASVCKLILLGNGSVGKSSICARFTEDGFQRVYKQTIGIDFMEKKLVLKGDKMTTLEVWDIGGQSISSAMLPKYIFGTDVVFLCYDVTDPQSFADTQDWYALVERVFSQPGARKARVYLVGNKIDLMHLRKITDEQHDRFVRLNRLDGGFFISAQSGEAVLRTFYTVAAKVANVELTAHELAFTDKVLSVTVAAAGEEDEEMSEEARKIAEEDAAHEAAKQRREAGGCACVML